MVSPNRPLGTVSAGRASAAETRRRYQLCGTRDWINLLARRVVLEGIRPHLLELPLRELAFFGTWAERA